MAEQPDPANQSNSSSTKEDEELAKLLDSSLQEFGRATASVSDKNDESGSPGSDASLLGREKSAQEAAGDFKEMLKQLSTMQKLMLEQLKTSGPLPNADISGLENQPSVDSASGFMNGDELQFAQNFVQNLDVLAEKAQKIQSAGTDDEMMEAIQNFHSDSAYESELFPFMQGLLGSFLSKDMLYPSLKEVSEKYPSWLEANRAQLEPTKLEKYEKQLKLIQEACTLFEQEKEDDSDDVKGQRFERLIDIMQMIQGCGHPPEDVVGALPPGWSVDEETGLPKVVDQDKAAETCSIM